MAIGDKALARGMRLTPGTVAANTIDDEINRALDYIAEFTATVIAIASGGTGATTAAAARQNLGIPELGAPDQASPNRLPVYNGTSQLTSADPVAGGHVANKQWVDLRESYIRSDLSAAIDSARNDANNNANGRVSKGGDTMTGNLFLPNSSAATSGWQVAYINTDGRVCRGSSSQRYKKFISAFEPEGLGDLFPAFQRYKMRSDGITPSEEKWRYGYIAEQMAQHPDQAQFVVYRDVDGSGEEVPDSIDFVGLLLAQVAQLNARVRQLEAAATPEEASA